MWNYSTGLVSATRKASSRGTAIALGQSRESGDHLGGVYGADGPMRDLMIFQRATTQGKQETRSIPVSPELRQLLEGYRSDLTYLFPGRWVRGHVYPESADAILGATFK